MGGQNIGHEASSGLYGGDGGAGIWRVGPARRIRREAYSSPRRARADDDCSHDGCVREGLDVGALQRSTGVSNMGEAGFRLELAEEAASAPAGDTEDGGNVTPFNPATVGWNKSDWTSSDWATWIVPGPIVTAILVGFIFYMYGPAWAVGTAVVMIGVDLLAFYTNA